MYDDSVPVSALKQFKYCKRRFSLMYVEARWQENFKITEGNFLHERVDNPFVKEKRGDVILCRSVPVYSRRLQLYGIADLIELHKDAMGCPVKGHRGKFSILPLDYKNGKQEKSGADEVQLCAIAMCLEEMFQTCVGSGAIFYGKTRRRTEVVFDAGLRAETEAVIAEILNTLNNNIVYAVPKEQNCNLCSLVNICLPNTKNDAGRTRKAIRGMGVR
ncbi:MAG: CRISPR-associated protein Cas4 [Christensenella sp.]